MMVMRMLKRKKTWVRQKRRKRRWLREKEKLALPPTPPLSMLKQVTGHSKDGDPYSP